MTPKEINTRLTQQVESLCKALLPAGRKEAAEWCVGSLAGEEGKSLKVCLQGAKVGLWADFAGNDKGDLIDLIRCVKQFTVPEAIKWAKEYANIHDDAPTFTTPRKREFRPLPAIATTGISDPVLKWFYKRGISVQTLMAYKVTGTGTVAAMPCYAGGDLMCVKYRDTAKEKKDGGFWSAKDGTPVLFGWSSLDGSEREIVITEGECDAMAYREKGIKALSVPMGAGVGANQNWIENDWERMERFDAIYLSMDMDDAGKLVTEHIANRIGLHRCRIVTLPCKDANDALLAKVDLAKCVKEAAHLDPKELKTPADFFKQVWDAFYPSDDKMQGGRLPWSKTESRFRLRPGETTIWSGINGHGKSMVLSHISSFLMHQDERVCVASMEMPPGALLKRLYQQACGIETPSEELLLRAMDWAYGKIWIINIRGTAKSDRIIDVARYAWRRYGINHLVVDSLAKCGMAEDDYNSQKRFVESLTDFAAETSLHVHLVAHARKGEDEATAPGKMDIKGTGAITDMVDNVASVWRNKKKEEAIQQAEYKNAPVDLSIECAPDAVIHVQKQRNFDWEGKFRLFFNKQCHQYRQEPNDGVTRYVE